MKNELLIGSHGNLMGKKERFVCDGVGTCVVG